MDTKYAVTSRINTYLGELVCKFVVTRIDGRKFSNPDLWFEDEYEYGDPEYYLNDERYYVLPKGLERIATDLYECFERFDHKTRIV